MEKHRTYGYKKHLVIFLSLLTALIFTGCGSSDKAGTQARTDLTSDHIRGLYSGMERKDIEDLLGTGDKSLADHEDIDVYSLSDGTTAVLRYRDDSLMGAYIRDKDNIETSIFDKDTSGMTGINGVNETGSSLTGETMTEQESGNEMNESGATQNTKSSDAVGNTDLNNAADASTEAETRKE